MFFFCTEIQKCSPVWEFHSPPMVELDYCDIIVQTPCILGAQTMGKCTRYSVISQLRLFQYKCHTSLCRDLKTYTSDNILNSVIISTLSNLWNVFIWMSLFTCVFDMDVPCLHSSTIVTSSRMHGDVFSSLKLVTSIKRWIDRIQMRCTMYTLTA